MLNFKRENPKTPKQCPQEEIPSILEKYLVNKGICEECGGVCCKNAPCHFAPSDFSDLTFRGLKRVIDTKGYITIVKIAMYPYACARPVGDPPYHYVLRVKRHGDSNAYLIEDKTSLKPCSLLTRKGCLLKFDDRPMGAKKLVPREDYRCLQLYSMEKCMEEWLPYNKTLKRLYQFYKMKGFLKVFLVLL